MRAASTAAASAIMLAFTLAGCSTSDVTDPQTRALDGRGQATASVVTRP